jgi:hypothetical protein
MNDIWEDGSEFGDELPEELAQELRVRNAMKRVELHARFGLQLLEGSASLPPDVEADWLDHIGQFEEAWESAKQTTVRACLGNPLFQAVEELPAEQLEDAIDRVLDVYHLNNLDVDCICEVPADEMYRFLTTELLDAEMRDMRVEGMTYHFIYEEFHPNAEHNVHDRAQFFLRALLDKEWEWLSEFFGTEALLDAAGIETSKEAMLASIERFREAFTGFDRPEIEVRSCVVDGDRAMVEADIAWSGETGPDLPRVCYEGISRIVLHKGSDGWWTIRQVAVPGWNIS